MQASAAELDALDVRLDTAASGGLEPGSAIIPAIGRRLGRLSLTPRRRSPGQETSAVPIEIARGVVAHLLNDGDTRPR